MAQDYTIRSIKKNDQWSNEHGTFQSYAIAFEGIGEPVSMNKKVPVAQEPQPGDVLYGSLELKMGKSGRTYYKFNSEKKPDEQTYHTEKQSDEYWQDRNKSVKAQFAIKTAVQLLKNPEADVDAETIEYWAIVFYKMVENVSTKAEQHEPKPSNIPQFTDESDATDDVLRDIPF